MANRGVRRKYALRRRLFSGDGQTEEEHPSSEATIAAGLKPGVLTLPAEKRKYSGNRTEYLEARDFVLQQWHRNRTQFLTEDSCLEEAPADWRRFVREVYRFLMQQGCINYGILKDDPLVPVLEGMLPSSSDSDANKEKEQIPEATDDTVEDKLFEMLPTVDLEVVTEKMIRSQLADYFGVDMTPFKASVREWVAEYLEQGGIPSRYKEKIKMRELERISKKRKPFGRVVVIGAGPSGISAALHLKRNNVEVVVLEARDRVGGRVYSQDSQGFPAPVDLGASIITGIKEDTRRGLRADPASILCSQLGIQLHELGHDVLPLYDAEHGHIVDESIDKYVEIARDKIMDKAAELLENLPSEEAEAVSFGELLDRALVVSKEEKNEAPDNQEHQPSSPKKVEFLENQPIQDTEAASAQLESPPSMAQPVAVHQKEEAPDNQEHQPSSPKKVEFLENQPIQGTEEDANKTQETPTLESIIESLTDEHIRLLNWHWANLEYGCSASLHSISAGHWNQDEQFGGFGGPHCMVVGGFGTIFSKAAKLLDVRLNSPVSSVKLIAGTSSIEVICTSGKVFIADVVIVTVPLGVLKRKSIAFDPPLPKWKQDSIARLGYGNLNKIVLKFPHVFWDDGVDFFGAARGKSAADRGWCFMFWNFHRFSGVPVLAALVSGEASYKVEDMTDDELEQRALDTLKTIFPDVPKPLARTVSRWVSDPWAGGSYSYVRTGATGEDYDACAKPVARRILFAGEHTAREHPDTVGGAMLSGNREAARALEVLIDDRREGTQGVADLRASLKRKWGGDELDVGGESTDMILKMFDTEYARLEKQRLDARQGIKQVWRTLLTVESTQNAAELVRLLNETDSGENRQNIVTCLCQASLKALHLIGQDQGCATIFNAWLQQAVKDTTQIALVDALLRLLSTLPVDRESAEQLELASAPKACVLHSDPDIRKQAAQLLKKWTCDEEEKEPSKEQVQSQPVVEIDPEVQAQLDRAAEEARLLREQAAKLKEETDMKLAQLASSSQEAALMAKLKTFDEYNKSKKKKRKKKMEEPTSGEAFDLQKKIDGLICSVLLPHLESKTLTKDLYKRILQKASTKVSAKAASSGISASDPENARKWLKSRHQSVVELVGEYVEKYKK